MSDFVKGATADAPSRRASRYAPFPSPSADRRCLKRNVGLYAASVVVNFLTYAFGDPSILLSTLAMKYDAPSWLIIFPMTAIMSIAYLPAIIMGWRLRPEMSRRRLYAGTLFLMYLPFVLPIVVLAAGADRSTVLTALFVGTFASALGQGLTILPCWDLFARLFPPHIRGVMVGSAAALGQMASLVGGPLAAGLASADTPLPGWFPQWLVGWMHSLNAHLPFPRNYAVSLVIYLLGGWVYTLIILQMHENMPLPAAGSVVHPSFRQYLVRLRSAVAASASMRRLCVGGLCAAGLVATQPLLLVYTTQFRGFDRAQATLLLAITPWVMIPFSLLLGYLSQKTGPRKIVAAAAVAVACAWTAASLLHGNAVLIPLIFGSFVNVLYSFVLVCFMNAAPHGETHDYLAAYYAGGLVAGLNPFLLNALMKLAPTTVVILVVLLSLGCAFCMLTSESAARRAASAKASF